MSVSQRAIAKIVKLSVATVSKALRNDPEIPPHTRAQVIDTAMRLGYRPASGRLDKRDKQPKRPQSLQIGLLIQSDDTLGGEHMHAPTHVLAGMTEAAHTANASVMVHYIPLRDRDRISEPQYQPVALREGWLAGVVLEHYFKPHIVQRLAEQVPCVTIVHHFPGVRVDCIDLDCAGAIGLVVDHLHRLGHRRIGFLGSLWDQSWCQARFAGYVQSLARLGIAYDPAIANAMIEMMPSDAAIVDRVVGHIRQGLTAWVASNDVLGYAWCEALAAKGINVPGDVSITGVDADPVPRGMPAMTSVAVPFEAMGRAAMLQLLLRIREPAAPIRLTSFEGRLVEGQTTATATRTVF